MTPQERKAMEQALEALEEIALAGMSGTGQESDEAMTAWHARQAWKFIGIAARQLTTIKEALAQPEQEPIGYWMGEFNDGAATLYEVPQESVFGRTYRNMPVYTTPSAQRTWVGLTYEEKYALADDVAWRGVPVFEAICEVEAKLKEKNNG